MPNEYRPLDPWLNLAALMPFDQKLPPVEDAPSALIQRVSELWDRAVAEHPELGLPVLFSSEGAAEMRYETVRVVRETLAALLFVVNRPPGQAYHDLLDLRFPAEPTPKLMYTPERGVVSYQNSLGVFRRCLEQTETDINRLIACPVCHAPFLPRRHDQKACTPNCANTFRVRNRRAREKGESK